MKHAHALVRLAVGAALMIVALVAPAPRTHGQTEWTIAPGKGVGSVRLGMTDEQVHASLKNPVSVRASGNVKREDFAGLWILFERPRPGAPFAVSFVQVNDGAYATSQGIHVGSSVFDVVGAFGDGAANITQDAGNVVECLAVSSELSGDKSRLDLAFVYTNRGITFDTAVPKSGGPVTVTGIRVFSPQRCHRLSR